MAEPIRIAFVALGCAKNLVDSEKMLGDLALAGAAITADADDADVIVVNTCGFLQASREEAHQAIAEALASKKAGPCQRVVVAGCLVQRDGKELLKTFPKIDALVGVHQRDDLPRAALAGVSPAPRKRRGRRQHTPKRREAEFYLSDYYPHVALDTTRLRLTPTHYAYLRIAEGCDQKCTFCTIPAIRGPLHSKPIEMVLTEARELVADGAFELNLIAQDTTSYGKDLTGGAGLVPLLQELDKLEGVGWLRLLYAYPSVFTDEMIDAIAACEHVVNYVDIPLQHINDRVLKAMARQVTRAETDRLLTRLRERIPGVAIRTTLIAGFPGETNAEFEELLDFIKEQRFDALGVFPYSFEPDTPSGRMQGQLSDDVKLARADAIMEAQQKIAFDAAAKRRGSELDVLIDGMDADGRWLGRHAGQAPEVDGATIILADELTAGDIVRVKCEGADGYDLIARPADAILPQA